MQAAVSEGSFKEIVWYEELCIHTASLPGWEIFTGRGGSEAVKHTLRDSLARMVSRRE